MIEDNQKRPWGIKGLSCQHAPYLNLAIAVVEKARADVMKGVRVFAKHGPKEKSAALVRAAFAWRWLSDPHIQCLRLSFAEICDGCGIDRDRALDGVDEMADEFPPGFRRHLEVLVQQAKRVTAWTVSP